eukprot:g15299.t1
MLNSGALDDGGRPTVEQLADGSAAAAREASALWSRREQFLLPSFRFDTQSHPKLWRACSYPDEWRTGTATIPRPDFTATAKHDEKSFRATAEYAAAPRLQHLEHGHPYTLPASATFYLRRVDDFSLSATYAEEVITAASTRDCLRPLWYIGTTCDSYIVLTLGGDLCRGAVPECGLAVYQLRTGTELRPSDAKRLRLGSVNQIRQRVRDALAWQREVDRFLDLGKGETNYNFLLPRALEDYPIPDFLLPEPDALRALHRGAFCDPTTEPASSPPSTGGEAFAYELDGTPASKSGGAPSTRDHEPAGADCGCDGPFCRGQQRGVVPGACEIGANLSPCEEEREAEDRVEPPRHPPEPEPPPDPGTLRANASYAAGAKWTRMLRGRAGVEGLVRRRSRSWFPRTAPGVETLRLEPAICLFRRLSTFLCGIKRTEQHRRPAESETTTSARRLGLAGGDSRRS